MAHMRMKAIRALGESDLRTRLLESRSELSKIRTGAEKGTIKKKSGDVRPLRRDIARMMTRLSEIRNERTAAKGGRAK